MSDKAKLWTCAANSGVVRKFQWSFDIGSLNIYIGILLIVIILAIAQHVFISQGTISSFQ
jgi:hypothetical protein